MKKLMVFIAVCIVLSSCMKISDNSKYSQGSFLTGGGVFVLNEGNFRGGNGSLSFYSYDSAKVYNDIFSNRNGRPLGDVPNSMTIIGEYAYIVVNNSGKIEVINKNTLESVATIEGLNSPRNISFANNNRAYITSLYSKSVTILDLMSNSILGYINLGHTSESIIVLGNKAFISNWAGGNKVMVVNTTNNQVMDSIEVGIEPESMVLDKNNMLWVLCNGGWERNNFAELIAINTSTDGIDKRLVFPTRIASPSCLQIDGLGETLYYLDNGVRKMDITASELPFYPFISESDKYYYKLGIDPVTSDIFVTDAVDYQQQGNVIYYKKDGAFVSTYKAGIIPGSMCFMVNKPIQSI
jgi:YVTN family beta-propeller protein